MYNLINPGQDFVYSQRHLQSVLLQVVWLPEPDILDVVGQAAARVVSIIKHHSLQVAVQDVDSERGAAAEAAAAAAARLRTRLIREGQHVYKSSEMSGAHVAEELAVAAHPLARFSIPQYSSVSSLQGLEVFPQPTSSDMSPQSSSPLHCRVLGMQRPGGRARMAGGIQQRPI